MWEPGCDLACCASLSMPFRDTRGFLPRVLIRVSPATADAPPASAATHPKQRECRRCQRAGERDQKLRLRGSWVEAAHCQAQARSDTWTCLVTCGSSVSHYVRLQGELFSFLGSLLTVWLRQASRAMRYGTLN